MVFLPVMVMSYGPPAFGVFSFNFHLPSLPVVVFAEVFQLALMEIFSPGSAHPQTGAFVFCWSTMLSAITAGSFTSA